MSYIFDALQRSQAERAEADKPGLAAALQLLERTEREASAQWSTVLTEEPAAERAETQEERQGPLFSGDGFGPGAAETDPAIVTKALQDEERRETFSHFQTLQYLHPQDSRLVSLSNANTPATEAFHMLGVRLYNLQKTRELKSLLITSTVPGEGKSMVAANLASTLGSGEGQRVLLLDGDLRRPTQPQIFGLPKAAGLSDYLQGTRSLTACIYHLPEAGIWLMPAGNNPGGSPELIQLPQLPKLIETLGKLFDWIVIDSPPVLPVIDTSVWARLANGILLVARHGTTKKRKLQKGLEALDTSKLIGAILNASKSANDNEYYSYLSSPETSEQASSSKR
jgi:capsular exopolysaccharide synthesis family protein